MNAELDTVRNIVEVTQATPDVWDLAVQLLDYGYKHAELYPLIGTGFAVLDSVVEGIKSKDLLEKFRPDNFKESARDLVKKIGWETGVMLCFFGAAHGALDPGVTEAGRWIFTIGGGSLAPMGLLPDTIGVPIIRGAKKGFELGAEAVKIFVGGVQDMAANMESNARQSQVNAPMAPAATPQQAPEVAQAPAPVPANGGNGHHNN